jgi:hypothetical protein
MKALARNKIPIHYANYRDKTPAKDEYGNLTGEYIVTYENPVEVRANVSAATGESVTRQFGDDVMYDRVIIIDDPKFPIKESSILWIETSPEIQEDGSTKDPHDYVVKQVATSLNSVSIAVSKVNVRV